MSYREVKDSLSRLAELTQSEAAGAEALCRECFREISAGLKADADSEDARVTAAAAGLAYYKLMLKRSSNSDTDGISSFKAGDVSITQDGSSSSAALKNAEEYFRQCCAKIIPLCEDSGFAFENVKVRVVL